MPEEPFRVSLSLTQARTGEVHRTDFQNIHTMLLCDVGVIARRARLRLGIVPAETVDCLTVVRRRVDQPIRSAQLD